MIKWIAGGVVLVVMLVGFLVWRSATFHITNTDPVMGNVSTISPFLQIKFNQPISASGLRVLSSSDFTTDPEVSGSTLTIPFIVPLHSGQMYTITLVVVHSMKGKTITNRVFRFQPRYIPSSQLSGNQRKALLQNEIPTGPTFLGTDALAGYGLATSQVANLEQLIITFDSSVKKAVIDSSSITIGKYDPNDPDPRAPILFNISIDGKNYAASVLSEDASSDVMLTLTNTQTGDQVYQGNSAAS
jgi:hypothetical protein